MKHRQPPTPHEDDRDPLWERSAKFKRLVALLLNDPTANLPDDLTVARRVAVQAEFLAKRCGDGMTQRKARKLIYKSLNEVRPRVLAPISDTPTDDLVAAWSQPEAKDLVQRILADHVGLRYAVPALHFALGVMLSTAAHRATPHIRHARDHLVHNEKLLNLISELALSCDSPLNQEPELKSYNQVLRLLPRISEGLAAEVQITLADIASTYSSWGIPAGRYLAVDGSLVPAWARQRSGKVNGKTDPELEARLRGRTPDAGYRAYSRHHRDGPDGGQGGGDGDVIQSYSRSVRGYLLTVLVDIHTGLPLVFDLRDAVASSESEVLRETLLPRLFEISPDLNVNAIVGDGAFDNDPTHEHLETHYGIHPVASRGDYARTHRGRLFKERDHPSVARVRGDGVAICRAHGLELKFLKLDAPPRARLGLLPGQPTKPNRFRGRYECPAGCGSGLSIPTHDKLWSTVTHYPQTPYGRPACWAMRGALSAQRNQAEAVFSSLQQGYKLGLDGAARTQTTARILNEALIAVALVTRALLTLYSQRYQRGEIS